MTYLNRANNKANKNLISFYFYNKIKYKMLVLFVEISVKIQILPQLSQYEEAAILNLVNEGPLLTTLR